MCAVVYTQKLRCHTVMSKNRLQTQCAQQACMITAQYDQHGFTLQSKLCNRQAQNANTVMVAECFPSSPCKCADGGLLLCSCNLRRGLAPLCHSLLWQGCCFSLMHLVYLLTSSLLCLSQMQSSMKRDRRSVARCKCSAKQAVPKHCSSKSVL